MKKLEKRLKELQKLGHETVFIVDVLNWIAQISREQILNKKVPKDKR